MTRVTSGSAKNKSLAVPKIPGIRLTQDVVKLAIFSILGEKVVGAECLDLYAGSGSLGIEALSRGARWCDFVDINSAAKEAIMKNVKECYFEQNSAVITSDAVKFVANTTKTYDIIFMDPFFHDTSHRFLLQNLYDVLNDDGVLVFTHGEHIKVQNLIGELDFEIYTERKYGATRLTIIKKK